MLAAPILVALTVFAPQFSLRKPTPEQPKQEQLEKSLTSFEERAFGLQVRMAVGALSLLNEQENNLGTRGELQEKVKASLRPLFAVQNDEPNGPAGRQETRFLQKKLAVARYLALSDEQAKLCGLLEQKSSGKEEVDLLLLQLCHGAFSPDARESAVIHEQLGWFGDLLLHATGNTAAIADPVEAAKKSFHRYLKIFSEIALLGLMSAVFFFLAAVRLLNGKWLFRFTPSLFPREYLLETFSLYLAFMLAGHAAVSFLTASGYGFNLLWTNIVIMLLMPVIALWPAVWGASWSSIKASIGLRAGGLLQFGKEFLLGPLVYFTSLSALILLLFAYSAVLSKLHVNPVEGAHPIVPIITSSKNGSTIVLAVLMAVVIAPFVEEIMFRGVLYSWLRSFCSPLVSMLLSAILFAGLHPQGVIGLVPLTAIGFILAFVREWRGSLIACMTTHACFNGVTLLLVVSLLT